MEILVSIDRIQELEELPQTRLVVQIASVKSSTGSVKSLLCGDPDIVETGGLSGVAIVTDKTEFHECLASLSFPEINVRNSQAAPAVDGTTSWIWTHPVYRAFTAEDAGILWLRGKPGSGKSVLARSIQRRLLEVSTVEEPQIKTTLVGDWFYHRRRGGGFVRHESFVRSVLYHFLQQSLGLFERFFRRSYPSIDPQTACLWMYDILVDIFRCICQRLILVVCIVDAVDEAESTEVIALIKSIIEQGLCSKARFIVLSRPNAQIERQINDRPCRVVED